MGLGFFRQNKRKNNFHLLISFVDQKPIKTTRITNRRLKKKKKKFVLTQARVDTGTKIKKNLSNPVFHSFLDFAYFILKRQWT